MPYYIFVTGGVLSSLGKGVASASIASLLEEQGLKVNIQKLDPYLNVDPGTMSPYQHGEVYVTEDGAETDLDLGHYERFTKRSMTKKNNVTAGRVYYNVIQREREGGYLGATVQVIPHITDEIKRLIREVEIAENPLLSGQSTRGYNVYNYTIDLDVAEFLKEVFENNNVPKGYYVIKNTYYNIEDDLLKLSITRQIDYYLLYRYFSYYLSPDKFKANYSIQSVSRFILRYIIYTRRKDMKDKSEEVVKKAFANGISLRNALIE